MRHINNFFSQFIVWICEKSTSEQDTFIQTDNIFFLMYLAVISNGVSLQKKRRAISITAYMDKTYDIRKIGGDKIALLGLFIVSLLIARIIVISKSAILLSEPIPLTDTGLSVSIRSDNGGGVPTHWEKACSSYKYAFSCVKCHIVFRILPKIVEISM